MNLDAKIIKPKLGVLELSRQLGNVMPGEFTRESKVNTVEGDQSMCDDGAVKQVTAHVQIIRVVEKGFFSLPGSNHR